MRCATAEEFLTFFADVMAADDDFFDKALEGFAMFAFNQGEAASSEALEAIYAPPSTRREATNRSSSHSPRSVPTSS